LRGRWAVELWLAHKAAATPVEPEVAQVLDKLFARVEDVGEVEWGKGSVNISFKVRGVEGVSHTVALKLYTDFRNFYLYCDSCSETSAKRVLGAVAERLRPAVEQLERQLKLVTEEWPRWEGNALVLPAGVGWAMFLRLWKGYNVSLRVEEGGRELLRVEVLEARASGLAKFRLWYYKWRETRPDKPYVDVEIKPYRGKDGRSRFFGRVYANKAEGILREHLAEIVKLLEEKGIKGVAYYYREHKDALLHFTGTFRDSVLSKLGVKPELPPGEPPAVQHLGGFRFKVGGREVEFRERAVGARRELYAELKFSSEKEAENFAKSLMAINVDAKVRGDTVRLGNDAFFGLLVATGATPPGLKLLYRSEEGDFCVYAAVEGGRMRFYFAVRHEGVWRVAEGLYGEWYVELRRAEREVLEALRGAVAKALGRLGRPAKVEEPAEKEDREGDVKGFRLRLYSSHLAALLEHAADSVETEPAEVQLEGRRVVVKAGGVEAEVEFKLLKHREAEFLMTKDVEQTLVLYKSLKELGVRVEITPKGVKVDSEIMWALITTAVEKAVERGALDGLPAEVVPGVELLKMYNIGEVHMYIFRADGVHYYFAVKTEKEWRAAGGKHVGKQVQIAGKAAVAIAEAINAIYREMGVERRVEVRQMKNGVPYVKLTNEDLRLLRLRD